MTPPCDGSPVGQAGFVWRFGPYIYDNSDTCSFVEREQGFYELDADPFAGNLSFEHFGSRGPVAYNVESGAEGESLRARGDRQHGTLNLSPDRDSPP